MSTSCNSTWGTCFEKAISFTYTEFFRTTSHCLFHRLGKRANLPRTRCCPGTRRMSLLRKFQPHVKSQNFWFARWWIRSSSSPEIFANSFLDAQFGGLSGDLSLANLIVIGEPKLVKRSCEPHLPTEQGPGKRLQPRMRLSVSSCLWHCQMNLTPWASSGRSMVRCWLSYQSLTPLLFWFWFRGQPFLWQPKRPQIWYLQMGLSLLMVLGHGLLVRKQVNMKVPIHWKESLAFLWMIKLGLFWRTPFKTVVLVSSFSFSISLKKGLQKPSPPHPIVKKIRLHRRKVAPTATSWRSVKPYSTWRRMVWWITLWAGTSVRDPPK